MDSVDLQPDDESVKQYYDKLNDYRNLDETHEGTVRAAFQQVLEDVGQDLGWTLVQEHFMQERSVQVDGALKNESHLYHGYWEAKDSDDDLHQEVNKKLENDYPTKNIIFQAPDHAVLIQDGEVRFDDSIDDRRRLVDLLQWFFQYREPVHEDWKRAVEGFKERVPELGNSLRKILESELEENEQFQSAFQEFFETCKQAINPDLAEEAVEEMLIQHILTERIFRKVFDNPDFVRRNVIAREIEKVIDALTSRSFSREEFLERLDRFYDAIEATAEETEDFSEKQEFLNNVYEKFFQGFAVDVADTHGIVYTPQPIVDFMVNSVSGLLEEEFDVGLGDEDVHVLDPFVGTGNFVVRTMKEIPRKNLQSKYGAEGNTELHANEVMLLPYYVASMNIEYEYYNRIGNYEPFKGVCLVDTFELAEGKQHDAFTPENTERINNQLDSPIKVILGNPPYNSGRVEAHDQNQNREYEVVDGRVKETYVSDSEATLNESLYDPFVKAIRWASDRIRGNGIVAYVTNNSFFDGISFDGMRKHLESNFDKIYHLDLRGDARTAGELRQKEAGNVFDNQVRVGIGITFFVKSEDKKDTEIYYYDVGDYLSSTDKKDFLTDAENFRGVEWEKLDPDKKNRWLVAPQTKEFESYIRIGSKSDKRAKKGKEKSIFKMYSNGIKTNNDAFVYDFDQNALEKRARSMVEDYNQELRRWVAEGRPDDVRDFVNVDQTTLKWVRNTRRHLKREDPAEFDSSDIRKALHRPFVKRAHFFNRIFNEDLYRIPRMLPTPETERENRIICVSDHGFRTQFLALMTNRIPDVHVGASSDVFQCFPFYMYSDGGSSRRENITDWALTQFRTEYGDPEIEKWDIFHYVYSVLHHPKYKKRYQDSLERQLPRIPYSPSRANFWDIVEAGKNLKTMHVQYSDVDPYNLDEVENDEAEYDWRVEKMRWNKNKTAVEYNNFLTLNGIPERAHCYELGNRSALEWVVNQYRDSQPHYKRYDIAHDPNDPDDKWHIVDLIKRVTTVSVKTVDIVNNLPDLGLPED